MSMILNPYVFGGGGGGAYATAVSWAPALTSDGWSGYTLRIRLQAAYLLAGSKVRLTVDSTGQPLNMGAMYCQVRNMAGDLYDFETTPIPVTFGGSGTISTGSGSVYVSDDIPLVQSATKDLIISAYFNSTTTMRRSNSAVTGLSYSYKSGNDAATVNATGYTTQTRAVMVTKVEIFQP